MIRHSLIALLLLATSLLVAQAPPLRVAAAADLQYALPELTQAFAKETGIQVVFTIGSSGNFYAQIENGAPFDVFLSADEEYPQRLLADGKLQALTPYGVGRLMLWAPPASPLDLAQLQMKALTDPRVQKIALADPAHAPYGHAAVAALKSSGVYDAVKDKLVFGENVAQAAQFVASGNADIGLLPRALIAHMSKGREWLIPQEMCPPLRQAGGVVAASDRGADARRFLQFLASPAGRTILARFGFDPPEKSE